MPKYLIVEKEGDSYPTDADSVDSLLAGCSDDEISEMEFIYELKDVTPNRLKTSEVEGVEDVHTESKPIPGWWNQDKPGS